MPVDLIALLENTPAPPMHVDPGTVLALGRRRRLRRRLSTTLGVLGAAALVVPAALVLRADAVPTPAPADSPPGDCLFARQGQDGWTGIVADGADLAGTPWLDSGASGSGGEVRVQVHTDTCQGLAVAVTRGRATGSGSVATVDITGRPDHAFWVADATGGGLDRLGNAVPAKSMAVVLLPEGQHVCGLPTDTVPSDPSASTLALSKAVTVPAGNGWTATFGGLPAVADPESAALRICAGTSVVAAALRPLNAVVPTTAFVDESTGIIVLPLDAYWPSELEGDDLASAQNVAMIACKRSKGVATENPRRVIPDAPSRPFGLWRMADAQRYGYVEPMSQAKRDAIAANSDPSQAPSQAEIDAAEQCVHEDPTLRALNVQPEGGPWSTAVNAADDAARSSQAWDDVVDDWARCLEDRGLSADRDGLWPDGVDTRALDELRVRPEDVALAVADVTCKQQTNTVQRLADIVAAAQAPWIEQYKTRFQEQRSALDQQLALARKVLKDTGL